MRRHCDRCGGVMAIRRSDEMWLVAYAMARCGDSQGPPPWLGASSWGAVYDQFYPSLGDGRQPSTFAHSLKNARDTFDPYVDRPARVGWRAPDHSVPPPMAIIQTILQAWGDRPDEALKVAVLAIRDGSHSSPLEIAPLVLLTSSAELEKAWDQWVKTIIADAEPAGERRWWHAGLKLHVKLEVQAGRTQSVALSRHEGADRWTVELKPLSRPGNANLLSAIGRDEAGGLWLLRQGWLHPHTRSAPHIKDDLFRIGTGLTPTAVTVGSGPTDRKWYRVCSLEGPAANVLAATTLFVARCDLARRQHDAQPPSDDELRELQSLLAADETMGFLLRQARPAEGQRLIWKKHAEVFSALKACLGGVGLRLDKIRPAPGYEVDGVIPLDEPILVEIKTAISAADIYTAVGQLILYRRLMCPKDSHRLVLVLPKRPSVPLRRVLEELEFSICVYTRTETEGDVAKVSFDEALSYLWDAPAGANGGPLATMP